MIATGIQTEADAAVSNRGYNPHWFDVLAHVEESHFWFRARNRIISTVFRQIASSRVRLCALEAGCGNGNVLRVLREVSPQAELTGLDLFEEALAHARRRCQCTLITGSILNPPLPPESFDIVGTFDVLEHLPDDRAALEHLGQIEPITLAHKIADLFFHSEAALNFLQWQGWPTYLTIALLALAVLAGFLKRLVSGQGSPSDWYVFALIFFFSAFGDNQQTRYLMPVAPFLIGYAFLGLRSLWSLLPVRNGLLMSKVAFRFAITD